MKTDPKARYQGFSFFFKEGFCWNNVLTTYIKCKKKEKTVQSTESMSFFSCSEKVPEYQMITMMNSLFSAIYVDNFINATSHCTTGDAKLIPIVILDTLQLEKIKDLFDSAFNLKRLSVKGIKSDTEVEPKLILVEKEIDDYINQLYCI